MTFKLQKNVGLECDFHILKMVVFAPQAKKFFSNEATFCSFFGSILHMEDFFLYVWTPNFQYHDFAAGEEFFQKLFDITVNVNRNLTIE